MNQCEHQYLLKERRHPLLFFLSYAIDKFFLSQDYIASFCELSVWATCHYQVLLNLVLWSCGSYQSSPLTMQTGPPLCIWENMALSSQELSSYLIPATKESPTEGFLSSELLQTLFSTMNLYSNVAGANIKTIKLNECTMNQLQQSRSFARSIDIPVGCRELHFTRTPVYEMT